MKTEIVDPDAFVHNINDSRTVLKWKGHNRVLCAREWRVPERRIPEHLIYYIEKGGIDGRVGQRSVRIRPLTLFWLQPGEVHAFSLLSEARHCTVFFLRFYFGRKKPLRLREPFLVSDPDSAFLPLFRELCGKGHANAEYTDLILRLKLGLLFCRFFEKTRVQVHSPAGLTQTQRARAVYYIRANIKKRFRVADVSAHLRLNPDYFSRQFRKSFGVSARQWIKEERIRSAESLLLESGLSVTEIAYELGYDDIYFFSRQFKEVTGLSPLHWRKQRIGRM